MINFDQVDTPQHQVFKRQFQQYLIRNKLTDCHKDVLTFESFTINQHNQRLVKQPGYEILLDNIDDVVFYCDDKLGLSFMYENEVIKYEFKIP